MTNTTALKKSTNKKGNLPERGTPAAKVVSTDTRASDEKAVKKSLQFHVTESVFNDFSARAAEMFGYKKGAKTQYFEYLYNKND